MRVLAWFLQIVDNVLHVDLLGPLVLFLYTASQNADNMTK